MKNTASSAKIIYDYDSISEGKSRLKIEISTREKLLQESLKEIPFSVKLVTMH